MTREEKGLNLLELMEMFIRANKVTGPAMVEQMPPYTLDSVVEHLCDVAGYYVWIN